MRNLSGVNFPRCRPKLPGAFFKAPVTPPLQPDPSLYGAAVFQTPYSFSVPLEGHPSGILTWFQG